MYSVNSSETAQLQRFPPVIEPDQQRPWQRFSSAPAKSGTASTFDHSIHFGKRIIAKDGLTEKGFCPGKEADRYLKHSDFLNLRKKEILYKKWLEDVSEPVLQKIEDKMNSQSIEEIRKRKQ